MSGVTSTISSLFGGGSSGNQQQQSMAAPPSYLGYRFEVEVKSGPTAKIFFNNLVLLAKQNATVQQTVRDHRKKHMQSSSSPSSLTDHHNRKKRRSVSLNDDDDDEEDDGTNDGAEIELESSEEEDDDDDNMMDDESSTIIDLNDIGGGTGGGSGSSHATKSGTSGADEDLSNNSDDGEIKIGEEGKAGERPPPGTKQQRKRLRKEKDTVTPSSSNNNGSGNSKKRSKQSDVLDDLFDDDLGNPWAQSRLGGVIHNIVSRERLLKNSLISSRHGLATDASKDKLEEKKGKSNRRGDAYAYESDDSFIDDTEYMDYIDDEVADNGLGGGGSSSTSSLSSAAMSRKASDFYVVNTAGVDDGSDLSGDEIELEEEEEEDTHGLDISSIPNVRSRTTFDDDDLLDDTTLEPELEKALDDLKKKSATLEKSSYSTIPHELDPELMAIAVLREKFYKRGVPKKLLVRLRAINGLQFADKTLKDRLKFVLQQHSTSSIHSEIDKLKQSFGESMREDMVRALVNKKDIPNKLDESGYRALTHDELKQRVNDADPIRLVWSKQTTDIFLKMCHQLEEWVAKQNEMRKAKKETDMLETNEELLRLFRELKPYLFKMQDLMKKYKSLKEKDTKKDDATGTKSAADASTSTSSGGSKKVGDTGSSSEKKDDQKATKKKKTMTTGGNEDQNTSATIPGTTTSTTSKSMSTTTDVSKSSDTGSKATSSEENRPVMSRRRKIKRPNVSVPLDLVASSSSSSPAVVVPVTQHDPDEIIDLSAAE